MLETAFDEESTWNDLEHLQFDSSCIIDSQKHSSDPYVLTSPRVYIESVNDM